MMGAKFNTWLPGAKMQQRVSPSEAFEDHWQQQKLFEWKNKNWEQNQIKLKKKKKITHFTSLDFFFQGP